MTAAFRITGGKDRNVIRRFQIGKKVRRTVKFLSVRDYLLSIYCMYSCKLTDFFFINSSVLLFHIWNIFAISRRYKSYLGHNSQIDSETFLLLHYFSAGNGVSILISCPLSGVRGSRHCRLVR